MPALNALLLCTATLAVVATAAPVPTGDEETLFNAHVQRALNFWCGKPRLRAVLSSQLIKVGTSESVDPPYTVLHRCDASAGCCDSPDRQCQMADSTDITLVFMVTDTVHGGSEYRNVTVAKHTRCDCLSKHAIPPK